MGDVTHPKPPEPADWVTGPGPLFWRRRLPRARVAVLPHAATGLPVPVIVPSLWRRIVMGWWG
jgi:hypothetical protein